jgi:hypothetical protein
MMSVSRGSCRLPKGSQGEIALLTRSPRERRVRIAISSVVGDQAARADKRASRRRETRLRAE